MVIRTFQKDAKKKQLDTMHLLLVSRDRDSGQTSIQTLALLPVVALFILFQRKMVVGGLTQGAVKG